MVAPLAHVCAAGGSTVANAVSAALHFFAVAQCMMREPWPEQPKIMNESHFDIIVVGGGSAGSLIASRLAELGDVTVLLVEAGPDPPPESMVPAYKDFMKTGAYNWNFTSTTNSESSKALEGGIQRQPQGRMLGGSGSANDMVYTRGFPHDFHTWADIAGPTWDWDAVLPSFKKTEHLTDPTILNDPVLMAYHSVEGEITVSGSKQTSKDVDTFLNAFNELGFPIVEDMTYPGRFGAGRFLHTIRDGRRDSTATAFISRAGFENRGNLFVLRNSVVTQILIDSNKTAYGVKVTRDEESFIYYADFEVVLSAGVFNTPKLLMLSGIGPRNHLEEMGIDVVHETPVGESLHDQTMVLIYLTADVDLCTLPKAERHIEMIKYLYNQTGALSSSDSMGLYMSTDKNSDVTAPDFAIYPVCIPKNVGFRNACPSILNFQKHICDKLGAINEEKELLSFAVVKLNPVSKGNVKLASNDPKDNPSIYSGTFSDPRDYEGYPEAMRTVYSLVNTTVMKQIGARVVDYDLPDCNGLEVEDDNYFKCIAQNVGMSAWRAGGSVSMGAVLTPRLKMKGMHKLRVADASAMPATVRGNVEAPVIMIAERAVSYINEEVKATPYDISF
ncbi:unnamed protein product [Diatraea saccharalis]|uniref:Uncharacterized protein n=1 Tax=Diatraea saccharalis TaxID=40085 RepID=A0A9N9WCL9_9NEOP|nr:unnamed protein product [Diatraea saccharalis]